MSLEYAAPAGCPDETTFKGMVKADLAHDPFVEDAADHVQVRMARRGRAMNGTIEWRDSSGKSVGEQVLQPAGSDCRRVVRAAAFALALQIQLLEKRRSLPTSSAAMATEPGGASAVESPEPKRDEHAPAPTDRAASTDERNPGLAPAVSTASNERLSERAPEPLPAARGATSPSPRVRPIVALGAGSSVGWGMSSSQVLLGRIFGSLEWQYLSLELALEGDLPTTTRRPDGAGFEQQLLLAGAATCMALGRWRACVLGNIGEVRLRGQIDRPASATVPIAEIGARIAFRQPLGDRLFVCMRADGLTNLSRWTATLDQVPVWTAPRFSAALGIEGGVRFR